MAPLPRRDFTPTPGTERCRLCRELNNDQHVDHPWTDVMIACWQSSWQWKVVLSSGGLLLLVFLASIVALIRDLILGAT